ncbi:enoyl-CoA hydratase/isomerase family protein [Kordiimonas laminariae]|uniref:enoyl-CoA hydratase/isomerase family protein n=1 Tax=Kordiimonas laminariae TaxID=2917717 RepID=UPI001FF2AB75|nr:enoyl-CoA hydratase/isomerase family protein [Kordiimonas laminariae]MCK0067941.1 enoyl-CoA hydratase/isomerase family protein [Kordiimonas laminariae]
MSDAEVLFETRGNIGLITLNRPKALNSLTGGMATLIKAQLADWATKPSVHAVVVVGAGEKAFCAGGDVVKVCKSYQAGTEEWREFFHEEYLMNVAIDEFPKPYISFVDGITMGGGVGVSIPGDFWVASEKTLFAMPETGLGLFPDVGGGWFLPRLPGETGMFLALTGARLKAADLYALGIASHVVASDKVDGVIDALAAAEIKDNDDAAEVLAKFHADPEPAPLSPHFDDIDDHFDGTSVEAIMESLKADEGEWAQKQFKILSGKSPTSMKVTYEQLKRGQGMETFRENMKMEYRIVCNTMKGNDFFEGVRAILLDKDNAPVWQPANLADVSEAAVEAHFESLGDKEIEL